MSKSRSKRSNAGNLANRREAAARVLWWRAQVQGGLQVLFVGLLLVDVLMGFRLVAATASDAPTLTELGNRLLGDAEEAAWLGWLTTFGWFFFDRMTRARLQRRSYRVARLALLKGHPKWFFALS